MVAKPDQTLGSSCSVLQFTFRFTLFPHNLQRFAEHGHGHVDTGLDAGEETGASTFPLPGFPLAPRASPASGRGRAQLSAISGQPSAISLRLSFKPQSA